MQLWFLQDFDESQVFNTNLSFALVLDGVFGLQAASSSEVGIEAPSPAQHDPPPPAVAVVGAAVDPAVEAG